MRRRGLDVVDATDELAVQVQDRDISVSTQGDASQCAIAMGCKRKKGVVDVRIGASVAFVDYGDHIKRYVIDKDTRERLAVFDRDGYFKPGTYLLLPPPEHRKIGARAGTPAGSNTRKGRARNVDRAQPLRGRVSAGMFLA